MPQSIKIIFLFVLVYSSVAPAQTCKPESIPASTPTSRFTDHGDGTVSDHKTGLIWKKCAEGQSGIDCSSGSAQSFSWQQALLHVVGVNNSGGFADKSDWRLPNIKELRTIVERQCHNPAINLAIFPATTPSAWFWSSSPNVNNGYYAWGVSFLNGYNGWGNEGGGSSVRLMRSGQ